MEFPNVEWITESSHPASGLAYQVAEVNAWPGDPHFVPGQFARVVKDDRTLWGPLRNTAEGYRVYGRFVRAAIEELEVTETTGKKSSRSYAEYELAKLDKSENMRAVFKDNKGGKTRQIMITPETMVKIASILRKAPENQW
jgi:hypothetical protein